MVGENTNKRSQGSTEYLLILAAVLVITAIAVYYVSRGPAYPTISAKAAVDESTKDNIRIEVYSGTIPANEWEWRINTTSGADGTWVVGTEVLDSPSVSLENGIDGTGYATAAGTHYVSLRHKASGYIYFTDQAVAVQ